MNPITGASGVDPGALAGGVNRFGELDSEDFLRIIFTELSNQDPLQPNDTSALLDQLNSIRSIEADIKLTDQLSALVVQNQLASASALLGKVVSRLTDTLERTSGTVVSARREGDTISLELADGSVIAFENIEAVIEPPPSGGSG